jgi:hypothetical protein
MKCKCLLVGIFTLSAAINTLNAQLITTATNGYLEWANLKPNYDVTQLYWQKAQYEVAVYKKNKPILLERYLRKDDSTYLYLQYNANGDMTMAGTLKFTFIVTDSFIIAIPDLKKDPDMSLGIIKDTVITNYAVIVVKDKNWIECTQSDSAMEGNYRLGKKEGVWKYGIFEKNTIGGESGKKNTKQKRDLLAGKILATALLEFKNGALLNTKPAK